MEQVDGIFPECIMSFFKRKGCIQFCFSHVEPLAYTSRIKATPAPKILRSKCERRKRKRMQVTEEMMKQSKSARRQVFSVLQLLYHILRQCLDE